MKPMSKKGWMVVKVDLEKAYDKIHWDFIRDMLIDAKLPRMLEETIMQCVSASSMQLIWNGILLKEFIPSRGVRQRDPLSPYLFVLGMEKLGHMIESSIEQGSWHPLMFSHRRPGISHLFFADDLLFFGRATIQ